MLTFYFVCVFFACRLILQQNPRSFMHTLRAAVLLCVSLSFATRRLESPKGKSVSVFESINVFFFFRGIGVTFSFSWPFCLFFFLFLYCPFLHHKLNIYRYAYLEFADPDSVELAVSTQNGTMLHNRQIKVGRVLRGRAVGVGLLVCRSASVFLR